MNSRSSSARPATSAHHAPMAAPGAVFQQQVPDFVAFGDSNLQKVKSVMSEVVGMSGEGPKKTTGTSPMKFGHCVSHQYTNQDMYREWIQAQQKEIRKILKGEIGQIKEMIENFGERLDSIQLIIRKSVEVSKSQETETSTTSSSMTVTKKLPKASRRRSSDSGKPSGKLISKELIRSLAEAPPGLAVQSPPEIVELSNRSSMMQVAPKTRSTIKHQAASRAFDSQGNDVDADELQREEEIVKRRPQKTSFREVTRAVVDIPPMTVGNVSSYKHGPLPKKRSNNVGKLEELEEPPNLHYHSDPQLFGRHNRSHRHYPASRDDTQNHDSYSAPFQFHHPHVVNANKANSQSGSGKVERKLSYISPIGSRPVSSESKLPLIPETDEISIHCGSSRESEVNCDRPHRESVEHESTEDTYGSFTL